MTDRPHFDRPLSDALHNRLLAFLESRFPPLQGRWHTLRLNGLPLGRLNDVWLAHVRQDWPAQSEMLSDGINLLADTWLVMADNLQHMAHGWAQRGLFGGWRNEKFDVEDEAGRPLFALERAAFRPLGLMSHAVHINGLTRQNGAWLFWIGRRSPFKAVDPDKLDNLVGGGVSEGESVHEAMMREGREEAGLDAALLRPPVCQNRRLSVRPVSRGLHNELLHIFDVVLPSEIRPENQDGEVAGFRLMHPEELAEAICAGLVMNDAALATLDAFSRYGLLNEKHALSAWLANTRRPPA